MALADIRIFGDFFHEALHHEIGDIEMHVEKAARIMEQVRMTLLHDTLDNDGIEKVACTLLGGLALLQMLGKRFDHATDRASSLERELKRLSETAGTATVASQQAMAS